MDHWKIIDIRRRLNDWTTNHYYCDVTALLSALELAQAEIEQLKLDYKAYRETAEEVSQAYTNTHSDSWILEEALRRITQTLDYAPNVGCYNGSEQRNIALEALKTVWKRREERSKTR